MSVPIPCCLDGYSFVVEAKVWHCGASHFGFLLQSYFGYSGLLCFHTHFMIACSSLEKSAGAMWLVLHIMWGLRWVVLTFRQYLFFQSTSVECFLLSLYLLQFPSQAFYSFQHTDLLTLWLGLFIRILWLLVHCKWDPFLYFSFCCFIIGVSNATNFCTLILYPATLLNSCISARGLLMESVVIPCIVSCHLQKVEVWLHRCKWWYL